MLGIILSPSTQPENHCLICGSEEAHCRHIADKMQDYLIHYPSVHTLIIPPMPSTMRTAEKLEQIVKISKDYAELLKTKGCNKIIHIPIHTNAWKGDSQGTLIMHYPGNTPMLHLANAISTALDPQGRVESNKSLYEMWAVPCSTLYLELFFHDNWDDAKKIHTQMDWIVDNICSLLLKYSNKK